MDLRLATAAVFAAAFAAPAFGQNQEVSPATYTDHSFCSADYSPSAGAGEAAAEELDAQSASEFAEMDLDEDGMVSQDEYIACRRAANEG